MSGRPHVFVDGVVDFFMPDGATLDALSVTWLFDEFATLYDLPPSVKPFARLTLNFQMISIGPRIWSSTKKTSKMDWPSDVAVELVDSRLRLTFIRKLAEEINLTKKVEVAF
ncbi:MAG: DUF1007 family protein [Octadecabacter sp.]|nr:DUF1007 family protein [Octadecabacter sp.]